MFQGWSLECFLEWRIYLRLAIPGLFAVFIEWSNFEIGTLASGGYKSFFFYCII